MALKRVQVVAQGGARAAEPLLQLAHLSDAEIHRIRGGQHPRTLLPMTEAAVYLRFDDPRAAEKALHYLKGEHVHLLRRGRFYFVRQESLDLLLESGKSALDVRAAAPRTPTATRSVARGAAQEQESELP